MTSRRDILKSTLSVIGMAAITPCSASRPSYIKEAMHWQPMGDNVRCTLCPNNCMLPPGTTGVCRTRRNDNGTLVTLGYGNPCAVHVDPIEKKPLYHVLPGSKSFSIAVAGCNLRCKNCQNYTISQASPLETRNLNLPPEMVISEAVNSGCTTIAYTYSEPIVWYEYMFDTAKLARKAGLKNLMITCGSINTDPLRELCQYMDAANIDLKSFSEKIYNRLNAGSLQPILDAIKHARECGMWVEITNLIVPQWTDDLDMIRSMCKWIRDTVGKDVPLHFSRFTPMYKLAHLYPTPAKILEAAKKTAQEEGLNYVYVGNVAGEDINTYCPKCGKPVIKRIGYLVKSNKIKDGKCGFCGYPIPGVWKL